MNIGVLGTGSVGTTLGTKLVQMGHQVRMGSRNAMNVKAVAWVQATGKAATHGDFADAARFGELIFNCTSGSASLLALTMAGRENLSGKILIDVANPLDFSHGMPPSLTICNTDSLAEQIQRAFPEARVVKTLNTMNCTVMVNPHLVPGAHNVFLSGNDAAAKMQVAALLTDSLGWSASDIIDLGDISTARGVEMLLPLWLGLMGKLQHPIFNFFIAGRD